ncbi:MAG TPA: polyribonucleotide nucleotidyltransferase [Actinomycetota bacterium]|nr:polyribonucleotide nucleotidyltransferase [Actinomycetota bacterium]
MDVKRVEQQLGSTTISLETGKLAKQADGAVVFSIGETQALVTAVASATLREGVDFFPLTVDIEERMYAVNKIPGSFFRREGRAGEKGILTARLTDRPLRPAFPDWFRHDVHIVAMIMQVDGVNQWDVHCITAASAALLIGGVPFAGPIAGVRVAQIRGRWVVNPTFEEIDNATIELVVAGRVGDNGGVDVLMVEAGAFEHTLPLLQDGAPAPTEEVLAEGLKAAEEPIRQLCRAQQELAAQCEIPERTWIQATDYGDDVLARVTQVAESRLREALVISGKAARNDAVAAVKQGVRDELAGEFADRDAEVKNALRSMEKRILRRRIVEEGVRVDGRRPDQIRPLSTEVGVLSRAHGTGLFQRGETQAMSVVTLAMPRMEQMIDQIWPDETKRYMHHYNFPPFSVGEARFMRGPGRREIGHGALAEKAVIPVVPSVDDFPYALRVVSEILESNGSTSMAATCASTLALMDAGVPLRGMVGGIAMGLVVEDGKYVTLTDILGAEDNYGDMDFKVAGTDDFVTALQLDTKTTGIPIDVLGQALQQAKQARLEILAAMRQAITEPRAEMSPYAPRIIVQVIPPDKIGEVIGPKGKMINSIVERTGAQIDIGDDGRVFVAGDAEGVEKALQMIRDIAVPRQMHVGEEFEGTVVNIREFGAFVNVAPGKDGLVHISKLGGGKRVGKVEDIVSVGDSLRVRISEIRPDGKLSLVPVGAEGDDGDGAEGSNGSDQSV